MPKHYFRFDSGGSLYFHADDEDGQSQAAELVNSVRPKLACNDQCILECNDKDIIISHSMLTEGITDETDQVINSTAYDTFYLKVAALIDPPEPEGK